MTFGVKGWEKFQHFKDRKPPWIKLYRDILDDKQWHDLEPVAAKFLVMLWLIASEEDGGMLPDSAELAFRLRMSVRDVDKTISKLSHWLVRTDITPISTRHQDDDAMKALARSQEREGELETEAEREALSQFSSKHRQAIKAKRPDLNANRTWIGYCGYFAPERRNDTNWANWFAREAKGQQQSASDPDSQASIEAIAKAKGMPKWDGMEQWPVYKARVTKGVVA